MWPHHPRTAKIRELLDRGTIGRYCASHGVTFPLPIDPGETSA